MSDKLTQNLTEATVVDTTNDRVPIYSAASPSELRYMTPDNLVPDASATVKGKVELATTAETETGTDATRAVTPDSYRDAFATTEAAIVHAATEKTTPADADELGLIDSAASYVLKKLTWANVKETLKTYFDGLYNPANAGGWISYATVTPTRASADDPTYVLTFAGVDLTSTMSVGMKVKWTQNSTVRYGIITAIAFSTNTTLTLYGGTDYDVDDTATYAISTFNYSTQKAPVGFPLDPTKWTVESTTSSELSQASPSSGTWYNLGGMNIVVPIGAWRLSYSCSAGANDNSATSFQYTTLSTGNNTESDTEMTALVYCSFNGTNALSIATHFKEQMINILAKTTYYLNAMVNSAGIDGIRHGISASGKNHVTIIRAVCAYL